MPVDMKQNGYNAEWKLQLVPKEVQTKPRSKTLGEMPNKVKDAVRDSEVKDAGRDAQRGQRRCAKQPGQRSCARQPGQRRCARTAEVKEALIINNIES